MDLLRSVRHLADATAGEPIDWEAVGAAAKASTSPGSLALTDTERRGYRDDVAAARAAVREATPLPFVLPDRVEIHDRHHWIDANVDTFRRLLVPIVTRQPKRVPVGVRTINNGSMAISLGFLARHVLGQYDPILLADGDDHAMYFVHPNIGRVADELAIDVDLFRRWIAFHEVTHAAEFGAAPWLQGYIESHVTRIVEALANGHFDRDAMRDLQTAMTAIEGYAELVMDEAFDHDPRELREKLDARRRQLGPIQLIFERLLGLQLKRQQYQRGKAFFESVVAARNMEVASVVWDRPEALPTSAEIDEPGRWVERMGV